MHPPPLLVNSALNCAGREMSATFERIIWPHKGRQPMDFIDISLP